MSDRKIGVGVTLIVSGRDTCDYCCSQVEWLRVLPSGFLRGDVGRICEQCFQMVKDTIPGSVALDSMGGWGYKNCPFCGSNDTWEKGSYDKCNDCGEAINFWPG